jgi:hypothetical protein
MERIGWVTPPSIEGMDWKRAAEALQKHSFECAQKIMELNNELLDLKEKVDRISRGY